MSGLSDEEEVALRAKAAQSGMDNAVLYVRRLIAAREAAAEQRGAERVAAVVEAEIRCWRGGTGHADRDKWISVAQLRAAIAPVAATEATP